MKKIVLLIALSIFAFEKDCVFASITMVVETNIILVGDGFEISMKVSNTGDEDSLVVFPELRLGNAKQELEQVRYIAFEGSTKWKCKFMLSELGFESQGIFPLFITIHYHDANMYPFSSPHLVFVQYGEAEKTPKLEAQIKVSDVKKTGSIQVRIKNPFQTEISGVCEIYSAGELNIPEPVKSFYVDKEQQIELTFKMENQSALPGSMYKVYAVIRLNEKGYHEAMEVSALTKILETETDVSSRNQIIGCLIFLGLLFFLTLYFEMRHMKGKT